MFGTQHNITTTVEKLSKIFHESSLEDVTEFWQEFNKWASAYGINSELHENFFLAQIVSEVGYTVKPKEENMNYSCEALSAIFNYYKQRIKEANEDGRCDGHSAKQTLIANKVYANRYGNGDVESGDGHMFKGKGYFQLTFRGNYEDIASTIRMVTGEMVGDSENLASSILTPSISLHSALAFWYANDCEECTHIDCVTEKINRYTDSYEKRKDIYQWVANI